MKIKTTAILWVLVGLSFRAYSQNLNPKVIVSNLENKKGNLYIGWYSNASSFAQKNKAVFLRVIKVSGQNEVPVSFDNIPQGNYAIAVYLDENDNGVLDKNFIGIPKEKYGFSNNVAPAMRAAKFEEAVLKVEQGKDIIHIQLK
jgi:uncharacterized protein (DUF2141 family)